MIKNIDGKWYYAVTSWKTVPPVHISTRKKCVNFRSGQKDRKENEGCLSANGAYLDGYHSPNQETPPYVTENQAKAFNL